MSAAGLSGYKRRMEDSFVIKDLATFRKWPHVMEEWDAMFNDYPTMAAEVFNAMFSVDGRPQEPLAQAHHAHYQEARAFSRPPTR